MIAKIQATRPWYLTDGDPDANEIVDQVINAGLPVTKEYNNFPKSLPGEFQLYTEIKTLEDLNRLVESFGTRIVYSVEDGEIDIEKYNDYRE